MSSAPGGVDPREYSYGVTIVDESSGPLASLDINKPGWLVTRILVSARSAQVVVDVGGASRNQDGDLAGIPVPPGACLSLEPNGAQRGRVSFSGLGRDYVATIEYWFPSNATGVVP